MIIIKTTKGDIHIQLDAEGTPNTVNNFLSYVKEGFYKDTIFHRVIDGFMIQGGGFTESMDQKPVKQSIQNEAKTGKQNKRGTLAMARTSEPHSATVQFFINLMDNAFLNYKNDTTAGYGYCVFGEVVEGMDVVDAIAKAKTSHQKGHSDVPVEAILIQDIQVVE